MKTIETPEERWGDCSRPYHLTGEVSAVTVFNRLSPNDLVNLQSFSRLLLHAAQQYNVRTHVLLVGSAADLDSGNYHDIDLLVHVEPVKKNQEFALFVESSLKKTKDINVLHSHSSLILMRKMATSHKVILKFMNSNCPQQGVVFDVNFADSKDGTYEDVLAFHRTNHLAFCELSRKY